MPKKTLIGLLIIVVRNGRMIIYLVALLLVLIKSSTSHFVSFSLIHYFGAGMYGDRKWKSGIFAVEHDTKCILT